MAVNATPPLPNSTPNIAKLNTFSGHTITVTKHQAVRNTVGQMVVPTQQMKLPQILELQTTLPIQHGPGFYKFACSDTGGTGDDEWMVRLGPELPQQEGFSMPGSPFAPPPPGPNSPPSPLAPEVVQIMPGFFHHAGLGLLRTPWGKTIQWREGDPWPDPPAHATTQPGASTPWQGTTWPPNGQMPYPGWGGYPVDDGKEKRLEAELAEMRRQTEQNRRDEEARRDREEQRRREEERERREEARAAETRKMFETLAAAITAKPTGPSETELRLQREADETKRKLEEREREETRRREEQLREEKRQIELKAGQDRTDALIRELKDRDRDRPDPLMGLMTTLFQTQSQQALETARLNRESADRQAVTSERHTQQLMETMRNDRTGAAEANRAIMEQTREMLGMQREVVQYVVENTGSGQPWYATAISGALDKLGPIANAVAASRQQQPMQPQYVPPTVRQPPAARTVAPATTRPIPTVATPAPAATIAANSTGDRPEGVVIDKTDFIVPGGPGHPGYRIPIAYVQEHGWDKTLGEIARQNAPSPVTMTADAPAPAASAMNGAVPSAPAAPPALTIVPPPADALPGTKPKKARGKKNADVAPPVPPQVFVPEPADPARGYSGEELEAMSPEQALAIVSPFDDAALFGPQLFSFVQQLRTTMPAPAETVEYIMQGHAAGVVAPAMDLLRAKQLAALIERLLPDAPEEYQEAVVMALAARLGLSKMDDEEEAQA